jgi:starch synthase
MYIVFAASESVPFAKTGGLADVVGALPAEIVKLGHRVTVYLPLYARIRKQIGQRPYAARSITIPFRYYNRFAGIVDGGVRDGVQFYFVECDELFDRPELYGPGGGDYPDNAERFAFFSRAVLEATKLLGIADVFHVHDWQSAMIPIYLKTVYADDPVLNKAATVMTIHNVAYQGAFPPVTTEQLLLPWDVFTMDKVEQYDNFNFLKGSLVFADMLTTVSRKYAEEIQTAEFGWGLEGVLRVRAADLRGILNGVDYALWNPATDKNLAAQYSVDALGGKHACRADLLRTVGLKGVLDNTPVIGIVSRFATQKGFDLLTQIGDELMRRDLVVVALGSGEPQLENFFRGWAFRHPGQVAVRIGYDEKLSHKIEAGSDLFLMPSRYEPCGLNQIYSLKYGTVPVVRATGGLDDTIDEWDAKTKTGTGFKFSGFAPRSLLAAIDRALAAFQEKKSWEQLMRNGMMREFGWEESAREYGKVYEEAAERRGAGKTKE